MARVFELQLPTKEKFVLLALADHADPYGGSVYPSIATVSRKTCIPERTVQKVMAALRAKGVLAVTRPARTPYTTEYRLVLAGLPETVEPDYSRCPLSLRKAVIESFGATCAYCRRPGTLATGPDGRLWQIDRIVPGSRGGRYESYNVTLSCEACNRSKGAGSAPHNARSLGVLLDEQGADSVNGVPNGAKGVPTAAHQPSVEPPQEPSYDVGHGLFPRQDSSPKVNTLSPAARIKFDPARGQITGVTEADRARWRRLYPAVDLDREIGRAAEWLMNHPTRRRSNIAQYLSRWLSKAQDDLARHPGRVAEAPPEPFGLKRG